MKTFFVLLVTVVMLASVHAQTVNPTVQERYKAKYGRYAVETSKVEEIAECEGMSCCRHGNATVRKFRNTWAADFARAKWGWSKASVSEKLVCARSEVPRPALTGDAARLQAKFGITPKAVTTSNGGCGHECCNVD
jgi:hypothetical protein